MYRCYQNLISHNSLKTLISLTKSNMESREASLNSVLKEHARKYFSLTSIKPEQCDKMCSKSSYALHVCCGSDRKNNSAR